MILGIILYITATHAMFGQVDTISFKRNAIYFEACGQGILYSINYDYHITSRYGLRVGFSSWSIDGLFFTDLHFTGFPITINYFIGKDDSNLELGAGFMPVFFTAKDFLGFSTPESKTTTVVGTGTIGYRYQPLDGGFVFRIGVTPLFTTGAAEIWGGISMGVAF